MLVSWRVSVSNFKSSMAGNQRRGGLWERSLCHNWRGKGLNMAWMLHGTG